MRHRRFSTKLVRYSDEPLADFIARVRVAYGFLPTPSRDRRKRRMAQEGKQEERSKLLADMIARCHARFDPQARFGSMEKWAGKDGAA